MHQLQIITCFRPDGAPPIRCTMGSSLLLLSFQFSLPRCCRSTSIQQLTILFPRSNFEIHSKYFMRFDLRALLAPHPFVAIEWNVRIQWFSPFSRWRSFVFFGFQTWTNRTKIVNKQLFRKTIHEWFYPSSSILKVKMAFQTSNILTTAEPIVSRWWVSACWQQFTSIWIYLDLRWNQTSCVVIVASRQRTWMPGLSMSEREVGTFTQLAPFKISRPSPPLIKLQFVQFAATRGREEFPFQCRMDRLFSICKASVWTLLFDKEFSKRWPYTPLWKFISRPSKIHLAVIAYPIHD